MARHHDHDGLVAANALEHIEAAHVGQLQIEQHEIGARSLKRLDPVLPAVHPHDLMPRALEEGAEYRGDFGCVVDDEDCRHQRVAACVSIAATVESANGLPTNGRPAL